MKREVVRFELDTGEEFRQTNRCGNNGFRVARINHLSIFIVLLVPLMPVSLQGFQEAPTPEATDAPHVGVDCMLGELHGSVIGRDIDFGGQSICGFVDLLPAVSEDAEVVADQGRDNDADNDGFNVATNPAGQVFHGLGTLVASVIGAYIGFIIGSWTASIHIQWRRRQKRRQDLVSKLENHNQE